jgi:hypothetical protein
MNDIFIRLTELPDRVKAMTVVDENADYNIYINNALSRDEMKKAYLHELQHIEKKHFDQDISVTKAEGEIEE